MALQSCRQCQAPVAAEAASCPSCGCPNPAAGEAAPGVTKEGVTVAYVAAGPEGRGVPVPSVPVPSPATGSGRRALGIAAVLYAGVFLWDLKSQLGHPAGSAYAVGFAIGHVGICLIVAAILALLARLLQRRWQGTAFLVLSALLLFGTAWSEARQQARLRDEAEAKRVVKTAMEQLRAGTLRAGALRAKGTGDNAVMANWVVGWFEEMAAIGAKYDQAYAAVDIPAIVSPQSFTSQAGAARAAAKLTRLSALVAGRKKELFQHFDTVEAQVKALPIAPSIKEDFLNGFASTAQTSRASAVRYFSVEDAFLTTCAELHAFMRKERGHYTVEGREVRFARPEAADEYNRINERLEGIAAEEEQVRQGLWRAMDESVRRMEGAPSAAPRPPSARQ